MDQKKLRELEDKCIQDQPPGCSATCPVHVDIRAFNKEIRYGNLSAAFNIFAKAVVFPKILGHICHHPCENHCKRNEIDEPVSIHELEKYCVKNAMVKKRPLPAKKSKHKIAILGGGLCGLTAAVELSKKGYTITIYEANGELGGKLVNIHENILPKNILLEELQILDTLRIEVIYNKRIESLQELKELKNNYSAIFTAIGKNPNIDFSFIDKITLATPLDGVFAKGSTILDESYINSVALGKKAAISIDRYIQKVSLDAVRENEGPYKTRLYTNIGGVKAIPSIKAKDAEEGYSPSEANAEANRCLQCECMECVKACEYLKAFGSYPKKYLREIYNNDAIVMGPRLANNLINSCSLCGLCKEVCPNALDMGEVIKEARELMVLKGKMPPSPHDFPINDMNFSNSPHFAMIKNAPNTNSSQFMFFPGCQLCATMPEYVELSYDYLRNTLTNVGLILGCCGAPADWVGQKELFNNAKNEFLKNLEVFDNPTLILSCSSCHDIFKNHYPQLNIISLWEIYDKYGIPEENLLKPKVEIAIHDACTARHEDSLQEAIRNILAKLHLIYHELEYSKDKTTCCGFGGLMTFANKEVVVKAIDRRINESQYPYLVYCAMCKDRFSWRNKETFHILDLIYGGIFNEDFNSLNTNKNIGFSQKRENRAKLKEKMLKELWGEYMTDKGTFYPYELEIDEEVQFKMEDRLILKDDILKVIHYAETTGNKLKDKDTGHFLAYHKPITVTYWVEYTAEGNVFYIHNVYSHRMEIGED